MHNIIAKRPKTHLSLLIKRFTTVLPEMKAQNYPFLKTHQFSQEALKVRTNADDDKRAKKTCLVSNLSPLNLQTVDDRFSCKRIKLARIQINIFLICS
jgi:hypothetical protein